MAAAPLMAILVATGVRSAPRRLGTLLLTLLAVLLAIGNGLGSAIPQSRPENGRIWVISDFIRRNVQEDGVILSVGTDPALRLGLQYLAGRRIVDLTLLTERFRREGMDPRRALSYWLDHGCREGSVWLLPDVTENDSATAIRRLGIDAGQWEAALSCFRPKLRRRLDPDGIVIRKPFDLVLAVCTEEGPYNGSRGDGSGG